MKQRWRSSRQWIPSVALMAVLTLIPLNVLAQMERGGAKEGKGDGGMMGGGMPMMQEMMGMHDMAGMQGGTPDVMEMMKMMQATSRLDLTPDQKKRIESLKLKHQKEAIPILARISMAEVELKELLLADSVDPEKVKAKAREKHNALAELEASHLLLTQQVKAQLTPEQRQKIESMMEMGPMMGMMGPSSGKAQPEKGSKVAPEGSDGVLPKTGDEHGH